MSVCPESVTGIHDNTDVQGRCLLCQRKIERALPFGPDASARRQAARAQDPRSIDGPDEADYLDRLGLGGGPMTAPAMSESRLQRMVLDLARWSGYLAYHTHDSRRSQPGFPDLVLVHAHTGRLIFAELKSATGRITDAQQAWLSLLGRRHEVHVWRPADWQSGAIRAVLTGEQVAA